jgi:hypothetical protein
MTLAFGKVKAVVTTPTRLGFALAIGTVEPEVCPGYQCFPGVPGSTVLEQEPVAIDLPGFGKGKVAAKGNSTPGQDKPRPYSIKATMEPAGEVHAFTLDLEEQPRPLLKLPVKIHLEGRFLGPNCYIGSNATPIELGVLPFEEPKAEFQLDPNGLPVLAVALPGFDLGDPAFAVPAAQGCGRIVGTGKSKFNLFDDRVNSALGLPSPAGHNALFLGNTDTRFVITFGGGAALQAAFAAAQLP